jgi:hypothetical protein
MESNADRKRLRIRNWCSYGAFIGGTYIIISLYLEVDSFHNIFDLAEIIGGVVGGIFMFGLAAFIVNKFDKTP